jgi:hypothetical protein
MTLSKILRNIAQAVIICSLPVSAFAGSHADGYQMMQYDDLEFVPLAEGSPVEMSVLWGDPAVGPVGLLVRFPAGFDFPLHAHTFGYRAVVMEGSVLHWIEGEDKNSVAPLGQGGYWRQPGGQFHGDADAGDAPYILMVYLDGPFDVIMPE